MVNGGETELFGGTKPSPRSRTSLVIDQLLSREPTTGEERRTPGRSDRRSRPASWPSVGEVLGQTSVTMLEAHLAFLVGQTQRSRPPAAQRVLLEDQARILIEALDSRAEDEAITRALGTIWNAEDVSDDDVDVIGYASTLGRATASEPVHSPYAALAGSAGRLAAEILDRRSPSADHRHAG